MAVTVGRPVVWGVRPIMPIVGIPDGARVKVRLRAGDVGRAYVKYADRIERWVLVPNGPTPNEPTWKLGVLECVNYAKQSE